MSTQQTNDSDQTAFRVRWEIDLDARDPHDAAQRALAIQRDSTSLATSFEVTELDADQPATTVDLHAGTGETAAPPATAASDDIRRQRFNAILDGYECGAGDWTMPTVPVSREAAMRALPLDRVPVASGRAAQYVAGRYALVSDTLGHGYFITSLASRGEVDAAAVTDIHEGRQPVCYFDLDELAGEPLPADEGDIVEWREERWHVIRVEDDHSEGVLFQWLYLDKNPNVDWLDGAAERVDESECKLVERAVPDDRMPVRYTVARVVVAVVFNTNTQR
jgi:hypothetical protein